MKQSLYVKPSQFEPLEDRIAPATFAVINNTDLPNSDPAYQGSLRWAATQAYNSSGADTITFASSLEGATIVLQNGVLLFNDSVTIKGLGSDKLTIDGNGNGIFFANDSTSAVKTLSVSGLKLTGGSYAEGGAIRSTESVILTDTILTGNTAAVRGGAIYIRGSVANGIPKLIIKDSQIGDNQSTSYGGGIYAKDVSEIQIVNSIISGNSGNAGLFFNSFFGNTSKTGKLLIKDSQITSNSGDGIYAGATYVDFKIVNSIFSGNGGYGASIYLGVNGKLSVDKSSFVENASDGFHAVGAVAQTVLIKDSVISANDGRGLFFNVASASGYKSKITFDKVIVANNGDHGLFVDSYVQPYGSQLITIKNSQFLENSTTTAGGGILLEGSGVGFSKAILTNVLASGNSALQNGGAIAVSDFSTLNASKLTIAGNSSDGGGGLSLVNTASTITGSTFVGNESVVDAGALRAQGAPLTISKTLFDGNASAGTGGAVGAFGVNYLTIASSQFNGNVSASNGGAVFSDYLNGGATITGSTFSANHASGSGGAVMVSGESITVKSSTFTGNLASKAGGLTANAVYGQITGSAFEKNFAVDDAGALSLVGAFTVSNTKVLNNGAYDDGGGIFNYGTLTLRGGLISGNVATVGNGGGIMNTGTITVVGTKVLGNAAASDLAGANASGATLPVTTVKSTPGNFIVTSNADTNTVGTLRWALDQAFLSGKAAKIGFDASTMAGTVIQLTSVLEIKSAVTINGLGVDQVVIRGSGTEQIFLIDDGLTADAKVAISGLLLDDGVTTTGNGGNISSVENLSLTRMVIQQGRALAGNGGGAASTGTLQIKDSAFTANTSGSGSSNYAGGLFASTSTSIKISNSLFTQNESVAQAGGAALLINGVKAKAEIEDTVFLANTAGSNAPATGGGGGLSAQTLTGGGTITLKNSIASGNDADVMNGGGIYLRGSDNAPATAKFVIDKIIVSDNSAKHGAGLFIKGATAAATGLENSAVITNSKFLQNSDNSNEYGGGIEFDKVLTAKLSKSTVAGNDVTTNGGGIQNSATLTISDSLIAGNSAANGGGLMAIAMATTDEAVNVSGSEFLGNSATTNGGAIEAFSANLNINTSLLAGNSATNGGAISSDLLTSFTSIANSITGNFASTAGGGAAVSSGLFMFATTIQANASGGTGGGIFLNSAIVPSTITGSRIYDNAAATDGGGVHSTSLATAITASEIFNNVAGGNGGGLHLSGAGIKALTVSNVMHNVAGTSGGGIYTAGGPFILTQKFVSENTAGVSGGGVFNAGTFQNIDATVKDNFAPTDPNVGS